MYIYIYSDSTKIKIFRVSFTSLYVISCKSFLALMAMLNLKI